MDVGGNCQNQISCKSLHFNDSTDDICWTFTGDIATIAQNGISKPVTGLVSMIFVERPEIARGW